MNVQQNTNGNMMYPGMAMPPFQLGDTVRAGMAVAQIPDLKNWEVSASIGELDRGHLSVGQKVSVGVVALAGKSFPGHVKRHRRHRRVRLGTASSNAASRSDQAGPELRPGMTSNMVITLENSGQCALGALAGPV